MAKILLAEDDVNLREIFEMRLKSEGYEVVTAGDGEEALVVATKELPDLIVVDVMMPKISGFEMLETLRSNPQTAGIKAIMMTALGQAEDRERGQKLGVLKYLVKSQVTLEDFVRSIHEILDQNQNNQQRSNMDTNNNPLPQDSQAMPPAEPTATPMPADPAATPAPADAAESTQQEQGEVQSQIDNFASSPAPAMPPAQDEHTDMPVAPAADTTPAPEPAAEAPAAPAMPTEEPQPSAEPSTAGDMSTGTPGTTVEPQAPQTETPQQ